MTKPYLTDGSYTIDLGLNSMTRKPKGDYERIPKPGGSKDNIVYVYQSFETITVAGTVFEPEDYDAIKEQLNTWYTTNQGNATGNLWFCADDLPLTNCYISKLEFTRNWNTLRYWDYIIELVMLEPTDTIVEDGDGYIQYLVFYEAWETSSPPVMNLAFTETWES